jgi:diguanylate cyclase (GGDEF)-like protein
LDDPRIRSYRDAAAALQAGRFDVVIPADGDDSVAELGRALQGLARAFESRLKVSRMLQLTEKISSGFALEDVLTCVYDSFRSVIPYDRIGVSFLEERGKVVRARWARDDGRSTRLDRGYSAPLRGSSLQQVISTGETRILDDLEAYLAAHPTSESTRLMVEEGIRSSLTCPLITMGKRVGFIFFSSRQKNTYLDQHRVMFRELALPLSLAIEKSRLYEDLLAANRQLEAMKDHFEYQAAHDPLTAIWNRGAIVDLLVREVSRSQRESRPLAVALADIDHFKAINDTHGHTIGDAVLREIADRLGAGVRSAEVVGRYGGDEFLIVLYPCVPREARAVMERLRRHVASRPVHTRVGAIPTTVSLGAAVADGETDPDWIVQAADRALYRAKQLGRNRVEVADLAEGLARDVEVG